MSVERNAREIANEAKETERKSIALATSRKWVEINYFVKGIYARTICDVARRIVDGGFDCFVRDKTGKLCSVADDHPLLEEVRAFVYNRCEATVGHAEGITHKFHRDLSRRWSGPGEPINGWVNVVDGTPSTVRHETKRVSVPLVISPQWETDLWLKERDSSAPPVTAQISPTREQTLLRTIGVLAVALSQASPKYRRAAIPNAAAIAREAESIAERLEIDAKGLSEANIRVAICNGLKALPDQ